MEIGLKGYDKNLPFNPIFIRKMDQLIVIDLPHTFYVTKPSAYFLISLNPDILNTILLFKTQK